MTVLITNRPGEGERNHLDWLRSLFPRADRIVIVSGWLKADGIALLLPELEDTIRRQVELTIYSNRPKHKPERRQETEREATMTLRTLGIRHYAVSDMYLHTKLWYFQSAGHYDAILGSANFTLGGLVANEELSMLTSGDVGDPLHRQMTGYLSWLQQKYPGNAPQLNENPANEAPITE